MIPRLSARMALCGLVILGALGTVVASGASVAAAGGSGTASDTVWLCQPGQAGDPCTSSPASTTVTADGATSVTPSSGPATS
jgi:ABC-type phosphate transport system substrate-binding protein